MTDPAHKAFLLLVAKPCLPPDLVAQIGAFLNLYVPPGTRRQKSRAR